MTEREKEAIENIEKQLRLSINIDSITTEVRNEYAKIILNYISKLQKEIDNKDKVINLMAEVIEECRQNDVIEFNENIDLSEIAGENRIKEYFYKKVEEEKDVCD